MELTVCKFNIIHMLCYDAQFALQNWHHIR